MGIERASCCGEDTSVFIGSGTSLVYGNGGTCTDVQVLNYGTLEVMSGGSANNVQISAGGLMCVTSAGEAEGVDVHLMGHLEVYRGAYVSHVDLRGALTLHDGVIEEIALDGNLDIHSGKAVDITVNMGHLLVASGGTAFNVRLDACAVVGSGGLVEDVNVKEQGRLRVNSGGIVRNVTITPGGRMYVKKGAIISGIQSEREMVISQDDDDMVIIG